jgi:hypothetical protein
VCSEMMDIMSLTPFGVRQLAAAFPPASLLAGSSIRHPSRKLVRRNFVCERHSAPTPSREFRSGYHSLPASRLRTKRQQAAALQSFAQRDAFVEFFRRGMPDYHSVTNVARRRSLSWRRFIRSPTDNLLRRSRHSRNTGRRSSPASAWSIWAPPLGSGTIWSTIFML